MKRICVSSFILILFILNGCSSSYNQIEKKEDVLKTIEQVIEKYGKENSYSLKIFERKKTALNELHNLCEMYNGNYRTVQKQKYGKDTHSEYKCFIHNKIYFKLNTVTYDYNTLFGSGWATHYSYKITPIHIYKEKDLIALSKLAREDKLKEIEAQKKRLEQEKITRIEEEQKRLKQEKITRIKKEQKRLKQEKEKQVKINILRSRRGQYSMTFYHTWSYRGEEKVCSNKCIELNIRNNGYSYIQEALNDNWNFISRISDTSKTINNDCICKGTNILLKK